MPGKQGNYHIVTGFLELRRNSQSILPCWILHSELWSWHIKESLYNTAEHIRKIHLDKRLQILFLLMQGGPGDCHWGEELNMFEH